jgi:hypothetical protein
MKKRIIHVIINLMNLYGVTVFAAVTIPVSHGDSGDYTVLLPEGWGVIPVDTIKSKLQQQFTFDLGIYPISQETWFSGNYALIGFIPAHSTLNGFTFNQIVKAVADLNEQSEIKSDTLQVHYEKTVPDMRNGCIRNYFSIVKDSVTIAHCQLLYLSKFGYVAVLLYQKTAGVSLDEIQTQLAGMIQIQPDYRYREPEKGGISIKHILLSLVIGLFVYGIIALLTKKRTPE